VRIIGWRLLVGGKDSSPSIKQTGAPIKDESFLVLFFKKEPLAVQTPI
jgi:hypothetical protein